MTSTEEALKEIWAFSCRMKITLSERRTLGGISKGDHWHEGVSELVYSKTQMLHSVRNRTLCGDEGL